MDFLIDFLFDFLLDPIMDGLLRLYGKFSDYSLFHPRLATLGKVAVCLCCVALLTAGMFYLIAEAWEIHISILKWAVLIGCGAISLVVALTGLRCLCQWLKKRKEAMYDPRNHK